MVKFQVIPIEVHPQNNALNVDQIMEPKEAQILVFCPAKSVKCVKLCHLAHWAGTLLPLGGRDGVGDMSPAEAGESRISYQKLTYILQVSLDSIAAIQDRPKQSC